MNAKVDLQLLSLGITEPFDYEPGAADPSWSLTQIADWYGTDKGSITHGYTNTYAELFKHLRDWPMPLAVDRLNPGGLIFMDDVFADGVPMPSGYYDVSHWNVLQRYQGVLNPVLLTKTLEGARIACAWVLRA